MVSDSKYKFLCLSCVWEMALVLDQLCELVVPKFKDTSSLVQILNDAGLRNTDPRLRETMESFREVELKQLHDEHELRGQICRETFKE